MSSLLLLIGVPLLVGNIILTSEITLGHEIYREEYETYETMQRRKQPQMQRKTNGAGSRTKYVEFAETEFNRPSHYHPVPFIAPGNNRLRMIPARTLSQLIRQHIAHNRMRQLTLQNASNNRILQGVRHITELRQTPFRRLPTNNTQQSYAEKRRQWKAELKRRMQGHKVPTRVVQSPLITDSRTSIQTDKEPDGRYFVIYSPQTRIYQVSRRPPPYLYTTDQDALPESLEDEEEVPITAEPTLETTTPEASPRREKITLYFTTTSNPFNYEVEDLANDDEEEAEEEEDGEGEMPPATTQMTPPSTSTTTTVAPLVVILQKAQPFSERAKEVVHHTQRVAATRRNEQHRPATSGKQIMFLDDYDEQEAEEANVEEEERSTADVAVIVPKTAAATRPPSSASIVLPTKAAQVKSAKGFGENGQQNSQPGFVDQNFEEDEYDDDDDDDLFFFKPGNGHPDKDGGEPFRILVHGQGGRL